MENTATLDLLRAMKSADEAATRVEIVLQKVNEKKSNSNHKMESLAAKLGVFICRSILHKQFVDPVLPNLKNKNRQAAAEAMLNYIKDDPALKEFDPKDIEVFFYEANFRASKSDAILFNDAWFSAMSEQFRVSLSYQKQHQEDKFDWSTENEEDE